MCGFAGVLRPGPPGSADDLVEIAESMGRRVTHRGPDDAGLWCDTEAGVVLAHRRLSIIDLSPHGHQPMHSACGRFVLAYNGEIYNWREMRAELVRTGERFRGHSDTEVLLAAIARWGLRPALHRAEGMFAFALWDRHRQRLSLARDRFGEKPLYYGRIGPDLVFGSELKALKPHPGWTGEVDRQALTLFLRFRYVPAPHTIYRGIWKVRPGTILEFGAGTAADDGREEVYWSYREVLEGGLRDPLDVPAGEAIPMLETLLATTVAKQMVADVPVGAFLSGGVDSSLVVAMMQRQASAGVKTFSIGFADEGFDEARHAAAVAAHLGTDHTEMYVSPAEALEVIPRLPEIYDEPFADDSQIPTYLVARLARERVTVALSGDGGDELFGGYARHFAGRALWQRVRRIPTPLRRTAAALLARVPPGAWDAVARSYSRRSPPRRPAERIQKMVDVLGADGPEQMYARLVSIWDEPTAAVLGGSEPSPPPGAASVIREFSDFTVGMLFLDAVTYLPDDILVKVDRAAMRVSLETRVPYLSHPFAEFAARLPLGLKIRDGRGKWILRETLHRHVPRSLVERPKAGFTVPIAHWLRGPLRSWAEELLDRRRLFEQGYFDVGEVLERWRRHQEGERNTHLELWTVLMFQAWLEKEQTKESVPRVSGLDPVAVDGRLVSGSRERERGG